MSTFFIFIKHILYKTTCFKDKNILRKTVVFISKEWEGTLHSFSEWTIGRVDMDADEALQMYFDEEDGASVPIARFSDSDLPESDDVEFTDDWAGYPSSPDKETASSDEENLYGGSGQPSADGEGSSESESQWIWTTLLHQDELKLTFLGSLISQLSKYMVLPIYKSEWLWSYLHIQSG